MTHQAEATMSTTNGENGVDTKLETLKTLNSRLLQETVEGREKMDSLQQENSNLEAKLTRLSTEKNALEDELKRVSEESESLEVEKSVFDVFMKTQMNGFSVELKGCLDSEREVVNMLREKVSLMEKKGEALENEVENLRKECERVGNLKDEVEKVSEVLRREKVALEEKLYAAVQEIEGLKKEVEKVVREKIDLENEKEGQNVRIGELDKEVGKLNEVVSDLQREEDVLRGTVLESERKSSEAMEREREMEREISDLNDVIGEKERIIDVLKDDKTLISSELDMMVKEVSDKEGMIRRVLQEKNEVEELKASQENENLELRKEVSSLRDMIAALQEASKEQTEKEAQLRDEISDCRDALDKITVERDDARNALDEERTDGIELRSRVEELENRIKENVGELEKIRAEHEHLIRTKTDIDRHAAFAVEEKDMLQKKLTEAQKYVDDLKSRMELANLGSERALTMLKNISAFVNRSVEERNGVSEVAPSEEELPIDIKPYFFELETVKKAFIKKDKVVEEMKREIEYLQSSMGEERKKKSFWTIVSSATTIFAAISFAFAARGH